VSKAAAATIPNASFLMFASFLAIDKTHSRAPRSAIRTVFRREIAMSSVEHSLEHVATKLSDAEICLERVAR
jgi:hypothetical protein